MSYFEPYLSPEVPGQFLAPDGCHYDTAVSLIQGYFLDSCGCGRPAENLVFVLEGLRFINTPSPNSWKLPVAERDPSPEAMTEWSKHREEREKELFYTKRIAYFFYYWADHLDLTEHGGAVPGWLTDKGQLVLNLLEEMLEDGLLELGEEDDYE